jgi:hypothetical protein
MLSIFTLNVLMLLSFFIVHSQATEGADPTRPMNATVTSSEIDNSGSPTTTTSVEKPLRLFQILQSKQGNKALINGQLLKVNDKIQQYTVNKIGPYEVSLFDGDTQKTLVISIFNQTPQPTTPTSSTPTSLPNSSSIPNSNALPSPAISKEAAILKALDIDTINIDQLLKPLQGSKP